MSLKNKRISIVIGAGSFGLTLAAFLKLQGDKVFLWGRNVNTTKLYKDKLVYVTGQFNGVYNLDVVSNNINEIFIDNRKIRNIYITLPAHVHNEIFNLIFDLLKDGENVFLMPGRTLGKHYFEKLLAIKKNNKQINVFETNTVFFTCRKIDENRVIIYKTKKNVLISCNQGILKSLPHWFSNYFIPSTLLEVTLSNMGMLLHPIPTMLNAGWVENVNFKFKHYSDGITKKIALFIEKIDNERLEVANALSVEILSLKDWLLQTYSTYGDSLYDVIKNNIDYIEIDAPNTLDHRYIYEDVLTGLIPLESMGKILNIAMKNTTTVIDMFIVFFNYDFRTNGRIVSNLEELKKVF